MWSCVGFQDQLFFVLADLVFVGPATEFDRHHHPTKQSRRELKKDKFRTAARLIECCVSLLYQSGKPCYDFCLCDSGCLIFLFVCIPRKEEQDEDDDMKDEPDDDDGKDSGSDENDEPEDGDRKFGDKVDMQNLLHKWQASFESKLRQPNRNLVVKDLVLSFDEKTVYGNRSAVLKALMVTVT